ncbi:unnamed protein product, partial [Dovyalis caffra]
GFDTGVYVRDQEVKGPKPIGHEGVEIELGCTLRLIHSSSTGMIILRWVVSMGWARSQRGDKENPIGSLLNGPTLEASLLEGLVLVIQVVQRALMEKNDTLIQSPSGDIVARAISTTPSKRMSLRKACLGMITRAKNKINKPLQKLGLHTHIHYTNNNIKPTTMNQALKDPNLKKAIYEEPLTSVNGCPQNVEEFLTKVLTEASRRKASPWDASYRCQTPKFTGYDGYTDGYDEHNGFHNKDLLKPNGNAHWNDNYDDYYHKQGSNMKPNMITSGGWERPSHSTWVATPNASLSGATNDISAAVGLLKEVAKPCVTTTPQSRYREPAYTDYSKEAANRYSNFNVSYRPYARDDSYTSIIDSREAARKYSGLAVGATNRPDAINPAPRRPGRFDCKIMLGIPDENARAEILLVLTRKCVLEGSLDLLQLAKSTPGFTGADLDALVDKAGTLAVDRTANRESLIYPENIQICSTICSGGRYFGSLQTLKILPSPSLLVSQLWPLPYLSLRAAIRTNHKTCNGCIKLVLVDWFAEQDAATFYLQEAAKVIQPSLRREGFPSIPILEVMDPAVLRPHRFCKHIYVPLPSPDKHGLILKTLANGQPTDASIGLSVIGRTEACENFDNAQMAAFEAANENSSEETEFSIKSIHFERALSEISSSCKPRVLDDK